MAKSKKQEYSKTLPCGRPVPKDLHESPDKETLFTDLSARLDAFSQEKKLNRSDARSKILKTIVYEARHFTALELFDRLHKRYPEVGKATLYRNLPVLVESGIIEESLLDPGGQAFYELSVGDHHRHHDHIVCTDCRRIFEFHDETIEKRQEQLTQRLGFTAKSHRHVIFAGCTFKKRDRSDTSRS